MIKKFGKIIVSVLTIVSFASYAFYMRTQDAQNQTIAQTTSIETVVPTQTDSDTSTDVSSATATSQNTQTTAVQQTTQSQTTQPQQTVTSTQTQTGQYKDGTYTGSSVDVYYGYLQVQAVIKGGKLTTVNILKYPNDRGTSIQINRQALPILQQEAIQAQSAQVDGVSGASDTSQGFVQSLSDALSQA